MRAYADPYTPANDVKVLRNQIVGRYSIAAHSTLSLAVAPPAMDWNVNLNVLLCLASLLVACAIGATPNPDKQKLSLHLRAAAARHQAPAWLLVTLPIAQFARNTAKQQLARYKKNPLFKRWLASQAVQHLPETVSTLFNFIHASFSVINKALCPNIIQNILQEPNFDKTDAQMKKESFPDARDTGLLTKVSNNLATHPKISSWKLRSFRSFVAIATPTALTWLTSTPDPCIFELTINLVVMYAALNCVVFPLFLHYPSTGKKTTQHPVTADHLCIWHLALRNTIVGLMSGSLYGLVQSTVVFSMNHVAPVGLILSAVTLTICIWQPILARIVQRLDLTYTAKLGFLAPYLEADTRFLALLRECSGRKWISIFPWLAVEVYLLSWALSGARAAVFPTLTLALALRDHRDSAGLGIERSLSLLDALFVNTPTAKAMDTVHRGEFLTVFEGGFDAACIVFKGCEKTSKESYANMNSVVKTASLTSTMSSLVGYMFGTITATSAATTTATSVAVMSMPDTWAHGSRHPRAKRAALLEDPVRWASQTLHGALCNTTHLFVLPAGMDSEPPPPHEPVPESWWGFVKRWLPIP
jgi:hypothetical protein